MAADARIVLGRKRQHNVVKKVSMGKTKRTRTMGRREVAEVTGIDESRRRQRRDGDLEYGRPGGVELGFLGAEVRGGDGDLIGADGGGNRGLNGLI